MKTVQGFRVNRGRRDLDRFLSPSSPALVPAPSDKPVARRRRLRYWFIDLPLTPIDLRSVAKGTFQRLQRAAVVVCAMLWALFVVDIALVTLLSGLIAGLLAVILIAWFGFGIRLFW